MTEAVTNISLFVSYSQIAVFHKDLDNPFNDWSPTHVQQGFSWRENSVSFRTLNQDGQMSIEIVSGNEVLKPVEGIRAILVPFHAEKDAILEIASISDSYKYTTPIEVNSILFDTDIREQRMWARLTLLKASYSSARVIIADSELSPSEPLLMVARPAGA